MTMIEADDRIEVAATALAGGPAAAVSGALEAGLQAAVQAARPGAEARLSSLNLELASTVEAGAALRVTAWVERATRTLAFASADVFAGERRVASGGGVFELS